MAAPPPDLAMPAKGAASPRAFWTASDRDIRAGRVTDIYFVHALEALRRAGKGKVRAVAEVTAGELPSGWPWAVFAGLEEVAELLRGKPVDLWALPEGTVFPALDLEGVRVPVLQVAGPYAAYAALETPLLGLVCQATGVATQAARFKSLVGARSLLSFGVRRMHPAIAPMVDRAAYLGGCDAVSCVASAERLGLEPQGTMPHALMVAVGDLREAWQAYDAVLPPKAPRIVLVDTFLDERAEAVLAAETLGKRLRGVRLDTPASRRGDLPAIVREVRWELAQRGRSDVQVIVSGGIGEADVGPLLKAGAEGFGVGTTISNAPTVNFALDLVEVDGQPRAKRGKFSGAKMAWRCPACQGWKVTPLAADEPACPRCGAAMAQALQPVLRAGKLVRALPPAKAIRAAVLRQVNALPAGVRPATVPAAA